jgi:hypothetical protein
VSRARASATPLNVSRMSEAYQEKGLRRIEENIARKPAMRRALSSLEENTLIRAQQIWLQEAERKVSPTKTTFLSALTDEAISPITVVEPSPLVLPTFHLTQTQRNALPQGWPPELELAARLEAASAVAPGTLESSAPAEPASDCHACPDPTQVAQGERRVVQRGDSEAPDASGASDEVPVVSLVIHDSRCPERPQARSEPAAEPPAVLPQSPSRSRWPGPLLKASRAAAAAAAAVASPRGASSSAISSPRGVSSPGTALLADLLDEAARQASSLTRGFNAPGKALYDKAPSVEAPSVESGGAGSSEMGGGGSGSDDSISGSADGGGASARLSEAEGAAQHAARSAEQARLELALAGLSRHETQGLRGEMQLEMAELQLYVLRLHEEQRALIAAHRERQQEFSEVQACACIIS